MDRLLYHAQAIADRCREATGSLTNEAELRRHVEPLIESAVAELYGLSFTDIRSERANAGGEFDVTYGGVVVEWEWNMGAARRRHGSKQALDYLQAEAEALGDEGPFTAVVTDGQEWGFLVHGVDAVAATDLFDAVPADPERLFVWRPNSPESVRRFLELVGSHAQTPLSARSVVAAFGAGAADARMALSQLLSSVRARDENDRTDTLYKEWRRSLEVAYGGLDDRDAPLLRHLREAYGLAETGTVGEFLFALHTYFALVSRLTALETLAVSMGDQEARPSAWTSLAPSAFRDRLEAFERGEVPNRLSVTNLLEGDVFGWYGDHLGSNLSLQGSIQALCTSLGRFAFPRLAFGSGPTEDVLRALYQGLTTRELRGALGEFLTPHWLAEAALDLAGQCGGNLDTDRVLDPTCGTGTFLRPILRRRLAKLRFENADPSATQVQAVLNGVVGFDINPVAVIAARMNYLILLSELVSKGELFLPVWLADSILLPEPPTAQVDAVDRPGLIGADFVELFTSLPEPFVFPAALVDPRALPVIATLLQGEVRSVATGGSTETEAGGLVTRRVRSLFGPGGTTPLVTTEAAWERTEPALRFLVDQLIGLEREGRNGVWAEIIENRFAPVMLGRFDLVVGNPPWLSWKKLLAEWKARAEGLWRNYGLFSAPTVPGVDPLRSYQSSDLATLVFAVALERYAKEGGKVAFLVPKALANGTAANRALRTYRLSSDRDQHARRKVDLPFRVDAIHDFEEVNPFSPDASNRPMVIVATPGAETAFPVPGRRWARRRSKAVPDQGWDVVRGTHLVAREVRWQPISSFDPSPLAWWYRHEDPPRLPPTNLVFGEGFNTRGAAGVYHIEVEGRVDPTTGLVRITNQAEAGRKEVPRVSGLVPSRLVIPVLRGLDVRPWAAVPSGYVLLPHDPDDRARPLEPAELQGREYEKAYDYLRQFRSILRERSEYYNFRLTDVQWWHVGSVSQLGRDGTILCFPEIADPPGAAVMRPVWCEPLGRWELPIPNHKVNFYRATDAREAYYLAGCLNSAPIQEVLRRFAIFTSLSAQTLRYLPIPPFSPEDEHQTDVVAVSEALHETAARGGDMGPGLKDLEAAVGRLLGPVGTPSPVDA